MLASPSFSRTTSPGPSSLRQTRLMILTGLFAALTVIGAQIRVPLPLVPFSLQTLSVLLSGSMLGPVYGAASQVLYLLMGLAGLPVFTKGGGLAYVFQPTFGYLLGFPVASFVAGALIHGRHARAQFMPEIRFSRLLLINGFATAAILLPGALYLWWCTNTLMGIDLPLVRALWIGALSFLPTDLLKIFAASYLYWKLQPRLAHMPRTEVVTPASTGRIRQST
jgi:biotin transport system substrate-specific component